MFEFFNLIAFALALMIASAVELTGAAQGAPPAQAGARQGSATQSASGNNAQEGTAIKTTKTVETKDKDVEAVDRLQHPETVPDNRNSMSDAELESHIQNALNRDPALGGTGLRVAVAGDRIELSGNVGRSREKQTAGRIAQSFAGSRRVLNQIAISEGGAVSTPATHVPEGGPPRDSKPQKRGLVTPSPSPEKVSPPPPQ